jgi:hypothetical protein
MISFPFYFLEAAKNRSFLKKLTHLLYFYRRWVTTSIKKETKNAGLKNNRIN